MDKCNVKTKIRVSDFCGRCGRKLGKVLLKGHQNLCASCGIKSEMRFHLKQDTEILDFILKLDEKQIGSLMMAFTQVFGEIAFTMEKVSLSMRELENFIGCSGLST